MKKGYLFTLFMIPLGLVLGATTKVPPPQPVSAISFTNDLPTIPLKEYNVVDFGAIGDGVINDTKSIQKAIDYCAENNGGVVLIPPGVYLSGTIFLKSNINLHLKEGAILLGSDKLDHYPETIPAIRSYTDNYTTRSLIYAEGENNIKISGRGIIDGQGAKFPVIRDVEMYKLRPYLLRFIECKNILVEDVTFLNSPMWVQHYLACDHLTIQNIGVYSRRANYNNDGIDIDGCHNVRITGCDISAEDDGIVLKSTLNRLCENVMVDNCTISSLANGFKLGTESNGGFKNITFINSHIYNTDNGAISLEIVDGGMIDGVFISNITMSNVSNPIFIKLGNRARPFIRDGEKPSAGSIRNITIKNIHATNIGFISESHPFRDFSDHNNPHIPASITGLPGYPVEDVHMENIYIQYTGGLNYKPESLLPVPENEKGYPEFDMFGQLPASGFYLRHVKNISFINVITETLDPDTRKEMFLDSNSVNISRDGKPIN